MEVLRKFQRFSSDFYLGAGNTCTVGDKKPLS